MTPTRRPTTRPCFGVRLIVLHAEGNTLFINLLGAYFASPSSGVSSHVGIDDTPGVIGVYVAKGVQGVDAG